MIKPDMDVDTTSKRVIKVENKSSSLDEVEVGEEDVITLLNSFCKETKSTRVSAKDNTTKQTRKASDVETPPSRYTDKDNGKDTDNSDYQDDDDDEEEEYNVDEDNENEDVDEMQMDDEEEEEEEEVTGEKESGGNEEEQEAEISDFDIDEKNKPRCTKCKKLHKPGWKDVLRKLGKHIIIPSPNDNYYELTCQNCSNDNNLHFKHTPKTYQSIIATGMYNMCFLKKGGNGYFCANEIIDFLLKYKKRLPAKSPIDGETYIRRIRSTISAFPHVFERCSKNGKRVRYRLVQGNKRGKGRKIGYKNDDEDRVKQENEETSSSSPSPHSEALSDDKAVSDVCVLVDERRTRSAEGNTKVFVEMDCIVCSKKCKIEWGYSSDRLLIMPGPTDDHFSFMCAECNNGEIIIDHKPKPWGKIMSTALYNLELIHTRQYFHSNDVYKFVDSHWEEIAKGHQKLDGWEKSAIASMYSLVYTRVFVCHPSKVGYWGLRDHRDQPPPYKMHFAIEKIVAKKSSKEGVLYYVKWAGFHEKYNTWEPVDRIHKDIVESFERFSKPREENSRCQYKLPPKKDKIKMERLNSYLEFSHAPCLTNDNSRGVSKSDIICSIGEAEMQCSEKNNYSTVNSKGGSDFTTVEPGSDKNNFSQEKKSISKKKEKTNTGKKPNSRHLTCSDCGKYIPIDPIKYPEARYFVFPTPKDFQYKFLCASCNNGSLSLQHKQRTEKQKLDMARYNLKLIGDGKDFTEEQVLAFIECHSDDFNPQDKKNDSTDESDSESSDEGGKGTKSKQARKNKTSPSIETSPPLKKMKKPTKNDSNSCISNYRSSCDNTEQRRKSTSNEKEQDVFLYFENQADPFGFVRINVFLTVHDLRTTILEEDVAQLDPRDLFLYKTATIKTKQEHKILIKEAITTDDGTVVGGQHKMVVRKQQLMGLELQQSL